MKQATYKGAKPTLNEKGISSANRIPQLRHMADFNPPEDFNPDEISWVSPRVGVTDWEGGVQAYGDGDFVICVAEELRDLGHVYIPVDPYRGRAHTIDTLDRISKLIRWILENSDKNVVVHCAMGMERSVLAVVWYLHKYQGMSMDEAYDTVGIARPIAADRRDWIQA